MRRTGTAVAVVALLAGLANWALPWLVRDRLLPASVPSPRALFAVARVAIGPGQAACSGAVAVDPRGQVARLHVFTLSGAGSALTLTLHGARYSARTRIAGGYGQEAEIAAPVSPPRRATIVTACVRNDGRGRAALAASSDRTRSRSITSVDGRATGKSVWLSFEEAQRHSILDRSGATIARMAVFRPGVVGPWLLWPLAALVLIGIPAGALWVWDRALRDDERSG
jgi:hypothetical protein